LPQLCAFDEAGLDVGPGINVSLGTNATGKPHTMNTPVNAASSLGDVPDNAADPERSTDSPAWYSFVAVDDPPSQQAPSGRAMAPSPGRDPRWLAEVLEGLLRTGRSTAGDLSSSLKERWEVRLAFSEGGEAERRARPSDVEAMLRELALVGWAEVADGRWTSTPAGEVVASSSPVADPARFSLALCRAHEHHNAHVVSRLLGRLWDLSPSLQGAVVFQLPPLIRLPSDRPALEQWLSRALLPWLAALALQTGGLAAPPSPEEVVQRVARSLPEKWEALGPRDQRKRLKDAVTDRLLDLLFGAVVAPRDFWVWQTRMDWAGLTLLARKLPGAGGRVWFPVGAFRRTPSPSFSAIEDISREGVSYHVYAPSGPATEADFAGTLYTVYSDLRRREQVEYVSLLSVRDQVCYLLRIGNGRFEELLQRVFPLALQGELPYAMALEVDLSPADRRRVAGQLPVTIDHVPRYILSMQRR